MSAEIQARYSTGKTVYAIIRGLSNNTGKVWNTATPGFETYNTANFANYVISMTEQGSASGFYTGNFPSAIPPGSYSVIAQAQTGGSPAETDTFVAGGNIEWNGSNPAPLSDTATSGQLGQIGPVKVPRGVMIQNWGIYFKSSADHVTPFVSGVISGQIARDAGSFGALQSGAFVEVGNGWYNLLSLTSGDLLANTAKLLFTAAGISGGQADPVPMFIVLQKVSGSV